MLAAACSDDVVQSDGPLIADQGVDKKVVPKDVGPDTTDTIQPDKGPPQKCVLKMQINGKDALSGTAYSSLDDKDSTTTGVQVDVDVEVTGVTDEKTVDLEVTGQTKQSTKTSTLKVSFKGVTLDPTKPLITIAAAATDCAGVTTTHTVVKDPSCTFLSPTKAKLATADNEDTSGASFKYTIKVIAANAAKGDVGLEVNAKPAQPSSTAKPDATGIVSFAGTQLTQGNNDIKATVTVAVTGGNLTATCTPATNPVVVDTAALKCDCCAFSPKPKTIAVAPKWGLGPVEDSDKTTPGLQTEITVTTDSKNADQVTLDLGDGSSPVVQKVTGDKVTFKVTIKEGLHTMAASCENTATKNKGASTFKILVDTTKPDAIKDLSCKVLDGVIQGVDHTGDNRKGVVTCGWKGVKDGKGAGVEKYMLHYRENSAISAANFNDATSHKLTVVGAPDNTRAVTGLKMPNTYYTAAKAVDYLGNVSDLSNLPAGAKINFKTQQILGPAKNASFGGAVAAGDFNCDGYPDLAVGLYLANGYKGEVQLWFGTGTGFNTKTFSKKIEGTAAVGLFGLSVRSLNFDNDANKCTDLAITAWGSKGKVYLYLGRQVWKDRTDTAVGTGADIIYSLAATAGAKEQLGGRIAAEDLDGDGADDLVLLHEDKGPASPAKPYAQLLVDYGETGLTPLGAGQTPATRTMPGAAELKVIGGDPATLFGYPMERGGKLNADKYGDLLIAAPQEKAGSVKVGGAYVLLGQARATGVETVDLSKSPARVVHILAGASNVEFGTSLAGLGDMDKDGTPEFAITDQFISSGASTKAGQVYIFDFKSKNPASVADAKATITNDLSPSKDNQFGSSLANGAELNVTSGADLNKDGHADMVVGTYITGAAQSGSAKIFYGSATLSGMTAGKAGLTLMPANSTKLFSASSIFLTDINKDSYIDLVVADRAFSGHTGRVVVYY